MQAEREILLHLLGGVAVPAATSAFVLGACRWLAPDPSAVLRRAAGALALGLGFAAGTVAIQGWPPLAQTPTIRQWLPYFGLALAAAGLLEARLPRARLAVRGTLSVLAPVLLLEFQRARHWSRPEGIVWSAGLALFVFAGWQALAAVERRRARGLDALSLACTTALAAGAYGLSGSQMIAQLAGALALACGLCALAGMRARSAGLGPTGAGAYWVLHQGLVWCGRFVSELSGPGFVLLALAPLALAVPVGRSRRGAWLATLAPLVLAGLALFIEWRDQPQPYGS